MQSWAERAEHKAIRLDGTTFDVEVAATYLRWNGAVSIQPIIRDISQRKLAERALRESESKFRDLVDGSVQGVLIHRNHKPIYVNEAFARIHGYTAVEILEMDSNLPLIASEDRERLQMFTLDRAANENVPNHYIYRGLRRDGVAIWLDNLVRVVDWQGERAIQSTVIDVTTEKNAEAALRESEARWRSLTEESPDHVILLDENLKIQFINQAIPGRTNDQILGATVFDFHSEAEEAQRIDRILRTVLKSGEPSSYETTFVAPDGETIYLEMRVVPRQVGGKVNGLMIHARRITDRKLAEAKLQRQALVLEQMSEGVLVVDTDGKLIDLNPAAEAFIGSPKAELLGRPANVIIDENLSGDIQTDIVAGLERDGYWSGELIGRRADGQPRDMEIRSLRLKNSDGEAIGNVSVIRDITERKKLERDLAQAQKVQAVAQLTSGVAHEFNNILAAIIGNLGLLEDGGRLTEKSDKDSLEIAFRAAFRGAELTEQLLAFAQQQPMNATTVSINELLPLFCLFAEHLLGDTVLIDLKLADDLWQTEIDTEQFEKALSQIVRNASDAMPNSGLLKIETANVVLSKCDVADHEYLAPGDYVVVKISDDGTGMAADVQERAFEPFFTTKDIGAGRGLGLSMVFGFVRQSGGQVSFTSSEGNGTTVGIYLPRAN